LFDAIEQLRAWAKIHAKSKPSALGAGTHIPMVGNHGFSRRILSPGWQEAMSMRALNG
jgi:hypothetical protein